VLTGHLLKDPSPQTTEQDSAALSYDDALRALEKAAG
jgi:hypothetical protein